MQQEYYKYIYIFPSSIKSRVKDEFYLMKAFLIKFSCGLHSLRKLNININIIKFTKCVISK